MLAKAKSGEINPHNKGMTYLEMKYNLLLSYCTFLAFYLLLKIEGREVKGHPVVIKLASIKALLEKLKPLDAKLEYQIQKMMRIANSTGGADKLQYRPNLAAITGEAKDESGSEMEEAEGMDIEDDESEIEDDMEGDPNGFENLDMGSDMEGEEPEEEEGEEEPDSEKEAPKASKDKYKAPMVNPKFYEDKQTKKAAREEEMKKRRIG